MRRAATLLALALLAGCGSSGQDRGAAAVTPPGETPPGALTAALRPADGDVRRVTVVLSGAAAPVAVTGLQLRGGGFVQVPPTPVSVTVAPGAPTEVEVAYGPVLCEGRPAPVAVLADTPSGPLDLPVDGDTVLAALRDGECG